MVRVYGRCRRGERLVCKTPWGHWKTTTFTCGLRCDGLVAPWVLEGPMTGDAFLVYVEKVLVPTLSPGDTVIIDNLASHKVAGVREAPMFGNWPSCRETRHIAERHQPNDRPSSASPCRRGPAPHLCRRPGVRPERAVPTPMAPHPR